MKLTKWFDGAVNPVRKGVYECVWAGCQDAYMNGRWFNYWDGKDWRIGFPSARTANKYRPKFGNVRPNLSRWRGVAYA